MHLSTAAKLASRRAMRRYRVSKLLVTLEIDVSTFSEEELKEAQAGFTEHTIKDYEPYQVADVLEGGPHMWTEHFAGSDLFLKFDQTRVVNAYWVE